MADLRLGRRALAGAAAVAVVVGLAPAAPGVGAPATGQLVLPDLVQEPPDSAEVESVERAGSVRLRLGVWAGFVNAGPGPLTISAQRRGSLMVASQVISRTGGPPARTGRIGVLRYVSGGGHDHWHLAGIERYELRTLNGRVLAHDHKVGFCLNDLDPVIPTKTAPAPNRFTDECGDGQPGLMSLVEGLSVGHADIYPPQKQGQYVDITGRAPGYYWLVARVDPLRRIRQTRRDDDVAARLVRLTRGPGGTLSAQGLVACKGSRCPETVRGST